jgi:hypothetical protein
MSTSGGKNTNVYGKEFENKTNNETRLLEQGFTKQSFSVSAKFDYQLSRTSDEHKTTFVLQNGLKSYMKREHNIDLFRCPDEAYIQTSANGKTVVKILEKKEQRVEGSVETKLWGGPALKREYELVLGDKFEVRYGFCVSDFLARKILSDTPKYVTLRTILSEKNIEILFGDNPNYFDTLDAWIGQ